MTTTSKRSKKIFRWFKSEKWCQGYCTAKDANDRPCYWNEAQATRWDLVGALFMCYPDKKKRLVARQKIEDRLHEMGWDNSLGMWNDVDGRKFQDIIKLCKSLNV